MRTSSAFVAILALAGCHYGAANGGNQALANAEAQASQDAPDEGHVDCALAGARDFARACAVDREETARGLMLIIRHPDGGFRRLLVTTDGRGVVAADGALSAKVSIAGPDLIEVRIGADRYRLPATVAKRPSEVKTGA